MDEGIVCITSPTGDEFKGPTVTGVAISKLKYEECETVVGGSKEVTRMVEGTSKGEVLLKISTADIEGDKSKESRKSYKITGSRDVALKTPAGTEVGLPNANVDYDCLEYNETTKEEETAEGTALSMDLTVNLGKGDVSVYKLSEEKESTKDKDGNVTEEKKKARKVEIQDAKAIQEERAEKAREEAENRAREEAEAKAREEAEAKAREEAEAKAREEAEAKAREEEIRRLKAANTKAREEETRNKLAAQAKAKAYKEELEKYKADEEIRKRKEAQAKAKENEKGCVIN